MSNAIRIACLRREFFRVCWVWALTVLPVPPAVCAHSPPVTVEIHGSTSALPVGGTRDFSAEGNPEGGDYCWAAELGIVSGPEEFVTFTAGDTPGLGSVTVTYIKGTEHDTATESFPVVAVGSVTPEDEQIFVGQTATFTATTVPGGHGDMVEFSVAGDIEEVSQSDAQITVRGTRVGSGTITASLGTSSKTIEVIVVDLVITAGQVAFQQASIQYDEMYPGQGSIDAAYDDFCEKLIPFGTTLFAVLVFLQGNEGCIPIPDDTQYEQWSQILGEYTAASKDLQGAIDTLCGLGATFGAGAASCTPMSGTAQVIVQGLPEGKASVGFDVQSEVNAWLSTQSFGSGLGSLNPDGGTAGSVPLTFTTNGNYGALLVTVTSTDPSGVTVSTTIATPDGPYEEDKSLDFQNLYLQERKRIKSKLEFINTINDYITTIQAWVGVMPVLGPLVNAILTTGIIPAKNTVQGWYNNEKEANLATAYNRLMAAEGLPEKAVAPPEIGGAERHSQEQVYNLLPR